MDADLPPSHNLFQVFLRLRPPQPGATAADRFLEVEPPAADAAVLLPTHIRLNPPNDRRRAIEKFGFTRVFEEDAPQEDLFHCTGIVPLIEDVLAPNGDDGADALVATLGVTGSGKSHTILGSREERGLTQLALDVVFRSIGENIIDCATMPSAEAALQAVDTSEATVCGAPGFLDSAFDSQGTCRSSSSRAPTPMLGDHSSSTSQRRPLSRPSGFPEDPDVGDTYVDSDPDAQYAVLLSMYEVYNDRIFDLLTPPTKSSITKEYRRRPLLFKSTESSPDRKVVAGLRKIVCGSLEQALMVLEAGLHERRVAGTGSNSVSSRSHGFICIEVKKRPQANRVRAGTTRAWSSQMLTVVDLAGSERARDAKTAGATLAEAGKINESLMYLGQCLQMQSDAGTSGKPNVVPFRQCKLTELLFSNSFPSPSMSQSLRQNPQKAVMIVTADPLGDFNATSQILRYSALAREVTVPRIPSITQTMASSAASSDTAPDDTPTMATPLGSHPTHPRPFFPPSHVTVRKMAHGLPHGMPHGMAPSEDRITMEVAALEIARMSEEMDYLRSLLEQETTKRMEAESLLVSAEDRLLDMEQDVREECAAEFEERLVAEVRRWKASLEAEKERNEEHWDRKVEVMERMTQATDDNVCDLEDKENVLVENLEEENERLRRELKVMRRELSSRSPSKRKPLRERDDLPTTASASESATPTGTGTPRSTTPSGMPRSRMGDKPVDEIRRKMEQLWVGEDGSDRRSGASIRSVRSAASGHSSRSTNSSQSIKPAKKVHKLAPRKWDVALDEDDLF